MNRLPLKLSIAASAMSLYLAGCGDDVLMTEDVQEACNNAFETTELCKYMAKWYVNDNGTWRMPTCDDVLAYPAVFFCDIRKDADGNVISKTAYRKVTIGEGLYEYFINTALSVRCIKD